ncbi:hypothetical protein MASR2M15_01770 [Anaerolineales bacterium]
MIERDQPKLFNSISLKYGAVTTFIVIILSLSGVFFTFGKRQIVVNGLSLDTVALMIMLALPAFIVALKLKNQPIFTQILNACITSLTVVAGLVILVLIESTIDAEGWRFIFSNYKALIGSVVTLYKGPDELILGLLLLIAFGIFIATAIVLLLQLSLRVQIIILGTIAATVIVGLVSVQIKNILTLADALALIFSFAIGMIVAYRMNRPFYIKLGIGFFVGAIVGVILAALVAQGAFDQGSFFIGKSTLPVILSAFKNPILPFIFIFGAGGFTGALITRSSQIMHDGMLYMVTLMLICGILNTRGKMDELMTLSCLLIFFLAFTFIPNAGRRVSAIYETLPARQRIRINRLSGLMALFIALVAPVFLGQYISNILDLVMLYVIMGLGLNVMVGYAGLLDLGYVASFAIGSYTVAILMTPSVVTIGCNPELIAGANWASWCNNGISASLLGGFYGIGILTFWQALPWAIIVSGVTGMALGVPVLGLRGDYLAIVTLGFGEITRVLTRSDAAKPLLGAAQGISPIPFPVVDLTSIHPSLYFEMSNAATIYYLYIVAVLVTIFVITRLASARLGRAWRAMRADEDVAEAMGIHLVRTKLMAYGISSAFAGLGGAIFAAQLRGIFPESFTLAVSINVLSLIIIGGLGSVRGVIIGALVLVGLPEVLRELQDYRLLAFGSLLVITMLLKPTGLLPPTPRRLSELASRGKEKFLPEGSQS